MKYEQIAKNIVQSAVNKHLKQEIKEHCQREAVSQARAWLKRNKTSINTIVKTEVSRILELKKDQVAKAAAAAIRVKSPIARYY